MRAATLSGMIFVGPAVGGGAGGGIGGAGRQPAEEPFKPRVVVPDPDVQQARMDFQEVWSDKVSFWKEEMERWGRDGLAEGLAEMLERMRI